MITKKFWKNLSLIFTVFITSISSAQSATYIEKTIATFELQQDSLPASSTNDAAEPNYTLTATTTSQEQLEFNLQEIEFAKNAKITWIGLENTPQLNNRYFAGYESSDSSSTVQLVISNGDISGILYSGDSGTLINSNPVDSEAFERLTNIANDSIEYDSMLSESISNETTIEDSVFGRTLKMGIAVDNYFYDKFPLTAADEVLQIMFWVDTVLQRDLGISLDIRRLEIYTTQNNSPFGSTRYHGCEKEEDRPHDGLLQIAKNEFDLWSDQNPDIGLFHLFTGRYLEDNNLGCGHINVACKGDGYASAYSSWFSSAANTQIVTAHEIGHNLGATHDKNEDGEEYQSGYIMGSPFNVASNFSEQSIAEITPNLGKSCFISNNDIASFGFINDVPRSTMIESNTAKLANQGLEDLCEINSFTKGGDYYPAPTTESVKPTLFVPSKINIQCKFSSDQGEAKYSINGQSSGWLSAYYPGIEASGILECGEEPTLEACLEYLKENSPELLQIQVRTQSAPSYDTVKTMELEFWKSINFSMAPADEFNADKCILTSQDNMCVRKSKINFTIRTEEEPATHTVSTHKSGSGSISPTSKTVVEGDTTSFTIIPDTNYSIGSATGCNGSLSGKTYTTGPITSNCTVYVTFNYNSHTVYTNAGTGGSISPSSRSVVNGSATTFTITPNTGYNIDSVAGCDGSLSGNTYTTSAITSNCTVSATFTPQTFNISTNAETGGSISPTGKNVAYGTVTSFTITPDSGKSIASVTGCDGSLSGKTYTTGAITTHCTINASFTNSNYTVSTSAGAGGSISPNSRSVAHGYTTNFSILPSNGYTIDSVYGCNGSLSENTYTTGIITSSCTVNATFKVNTYKCKEYNYSNDQHVSANRAIKETTSGWWWTSSTTYKAIGSNENLGSSGSTVVKLKEDPQGYFAMGECPKDPAPPTINTLSDPTVKKISDNGDTITFEITATGTASDPNNDIKRVIIAGAPYSNVCTGTTNFSCSLQLEIEKSSLPVTHSHYFGVYAEDEMMFTSSSKLFSSVTFKDTSCQEITTDLNTHYAEGRVWSELIRTWFFEKWYIYATGSDELVGHDGRDIVTLHEFDNSGIWHNGSCP